jgi:hypothetical protein
LFSKSSEEEYVSVIAAVVIMINAKIPINKVFLITKMAGRFLYRSIILI